MEPLQPVQAAHDGSGEDREILLKRGRQRAIISTLGASLRRYHVEDESVKEIIWGYQGAENKKGGQGDVLIPFPGRIGSGHYRFEGQTYQLERNDKDGPNAIHGFLRKRIWTVLESRPDHVTLTADLPGREPPEGYPFSIRASLTYRLSESGLGCELTLENTGHRNAPIGAGFHPYFSVGTESIDHAELRLPASRTLELDSTLVPTGRLLDVEGTPLDFRKKRPIGEEKLNTCYLELERDSDGLCRIELSHAATRRSVTVWMDRAFPYVVLYTGDAIPGAARQALAIEPMTCATDAFNRPDWGLLRLCPGDRHTARWGISSTLLAPRI